MKMQKFKVNENVEIGYDGTGKYVEIIDNKGKYVDMKHILKNYGETIMNAVIDADDNYIDPWWLNPLTDAEKLSIKSPKKSDKKQSEKI